MTPDSIPEIAPECPINGLTDAFYVYVVKDRLDKTARWFQKALFPLWSNFLYYSFHWLGMPFPKRVHAKRAIRQGDADLIAKLILERLSDSGYIQPFATKDASRLVHSVLKQHGSRGVEWIEGLMISVDESRARELCALGERRFYDELPIVAALPNDTCFYKCASKPKLKGVKTRRDLVLPRVVPVLQSDLNAIQEGLSRLV